MTTIIYSKSEKVLVADGRCTEGNRIASENFSKVRKYQSTDFGSVYVACAGNVSHILEVFNFIDQVFNGYEPDGIKFDSGTLQVLMMDEHANLYEGLLTESSTDINWLALDEEYVTIGSGADFALGALEAGLGAEEALVVAARRDVFTNDNVMVYHADDLSYLETIKDRRDSLIEEIELLSKEIQDLSGESEIRIQLCDSGLEEIKEDPLVKSEGSDAESE